MTNDQYWYRLRLMQFHIPTINPYRVISTVTFKPTYPPTLESLLDSLKRKYTQEILIADFLEISEGYAGQYSFKCYSSCLIPLSSGKPDKGKLAKMQKYEDQQAAFYAQIYRKKPIAELLPNAKDFPGPSQ